MARQRPNGLPEIVVAAAKLAATARASLDATLAGGQATAEELRELVDTQRETERQFACALVGSLSGSLTDEERRKLVLLFGAAALVYPEIIRPVAAIIGETVEAIEFERDLFSAGVEKFAASGSPLLRIVN